MKRKLFLCPFISFVLLASLNAQNNYKKGYVITNDNDTIYGLIDFRTDAINATRCTFKSEQAEKIYYPGDIAGYKFSDEGKYYVTREVTIDSIPQKFFLEYLVQGMMDLYYLRSDGKVYYLFDKDGDLIEITKKEDFIDVNSLRLIKDVKYKNTLKRYFKDYPTITNRLSNIDFKQKSFINIAKLYHDETCSTGEECIIFENQHPDKNPSVLQLTVFGGLQWGTYTLINDKDRKYKFGGMQPTIGLKGNVFNPRWSQSFAVQLEVSFSRIDGSNEVVFSGYKLNFDMNVIYGTGKVGLEYKLPLKKIRPLIGGGLAYTRIFADNVKYSYQNSPEKKYLYSLRNSYFGYFINAGVSYALNKKHDLLLQASIQQNGTVDTAQKNGSDKFKSYNIVLGYSF